MNANAQDTIILIHGFGAHRLTMVPMALRFQRLGYHVVNVGYPSWMSIRKNSLRLQQRLQELDQKPSSGQIHIVAHSMGSIVTRCALTEFRPKRLGRVVMMTPPSKGSPRADLLSPGLGWAITPLQELRTHQDSLVNQLPAPDYRFAIIQATHDFIVPAPFQDLEGAEDHLLIRGIHSYILIAPGAVSQIDAYLSTGRFAAASDSQSQSA